LSYYANGEISTKRGGGKERCLIRGLGAVWWQ